MLSFVPMIILFVCFVLGIPIVFSLFCAVVPYLAFINTSMPAHLILQRVVAQLESSSTWAIPLFIMAGSIMSYAGISKRLLKLAEAVVGSMQGGLAQVNVVLSAMMGGLSGSAAGDAASDCKILVPTMLDHGYDKDFSAAVTCASSLITPIIPPGITLIMFATMTNVSIGKMFCAGYVPGLIMCVAEMILVWYYSKKRNYKPSREKMASMGEIGKLLKEASWAMVIPFGLIMMLRFGVCTATEGGAILSVYSLFIGMFVYKEIKLEDLWPIMKDFVCSCATVVIMICAANAFSWYMSYEGITTRITTALMSGEFNYYTFYFMCIVLYLILGMFIDGGAVMIMIVPLLLPTVLALNIDLVHFGIIMCLMSAIGALTPPFGVIVYLVSPLLSIRAADVFKACMPFIILFLALVSLFILVPDIITIVPNLIYG